MATHRLDNYLRTYRKQSGLSQPEVAFLLGGDTGTQISRYERRRRLPPLRAALACQAVFGVPVADLFAGVSDRVARDVDARRRILQTKLQDPKTDEKKSAAALRTHKLQWLARGDSRPSTGETLPQS